MLWDLPGQCLFVDVLRLLSYEDTSLTNPYTNLSRSLCGNLAFYHHPIARIAKIAIPGYANALPVILLTVYITGDYGGVADQQSTADLPSASPTRSYWQQTYSNDITHHRTTSTLPEEASVVIIGSGISGAIAAREVAAQGHEGIVVLEARDLCSGATGRVSG